PSARSSLPLLRGDEAQRQSVVAEPETLRSGPVIEDVSLVAAAAGAVILDSRHGQGVVRLRLHVALQRTHEARPAAPALVLGVGAEEGVTAGGAEVHPLALLLVQRARSGRLGALLEQHAVALGRKLLLPLLAGLVDGRSIIR